MSGNIRSLLLITLLCVLASRSMAQHPFDEGQQKRIGITSQQQKEIEAVFGEAGPKRQAMRMHLNDLYKELHELYDTYDFDKRRARSITNEIVAQHQRIMALFAENEMKLRRILNRDQFERLRAEMKAAREQHRREHPDWGGNHPPGGPGDPMHGPPGPGSSPREEPR